MSEACDDGDCESPGYFEQGYGQDDDDEDVIDENGEEEEHDVQETPLQATPGGACSTQQGTPTTSFRTPDQPLAPSQHPQSDGGISNRQNALAKHAAPVS